MRMPNKALKILVEGICRAKIVSAVQAHSFLSVGFQDIETTGVEPSKEFEAIWRQVKTLYYQYTQLNEHAPKELITAVRTVHDVDYIADTIAVHLNLAFDERQAILEQCDLQKRLFDLANLLQKEIDILETEKRIQSRIQKQVEKNQREYYLTEQIKAIHKELGREDHLIEINELHERIKKANLSAEALEKAERELHKLEQMQPLSAEASVSRNYIDWLVAIPWKKMSRDSISLKQAEKILNTSHDGLKKPKERILEFIAAKKFSKSLEKAPIICFIGPPGVGKTSLAQTIAKSLGREFVRISLGGIKDEAEIRGHRRTYIGALPGKIIQAIKRASTINPVMLLDEIDKLSHDFMGDPSSALLEVLDPDQNNRFADHFLDVDYDLSKIMFIATANGYENIPYPLLDRMELITLTGYTQEEKLAIAKKFLIPKKLAEHDLTPKLFHLDDDTLNFIIDSYTKEAGVRQLERVIASLMRKTIQQLLDKKTTTVIINKEQIVQWLGPQKFKPTSLGKTPLAGVATGLAWTELGGDVLEIEASQLPGKGNLLLTGQLGEIMQESAQASLSYIKSRSTEFGIRKSTFTNYDLHVHMPEGATPKDGPSAGITIACALISTLTNTSLKPQTALTGEITLRGRVLAVGGLKEKILAARRHGIKTVILPQENSEEIQEELKGIDHGLDIKYVTHMDEVVNCVFDHNPFQKNKKDAKVKKVQKNERRK
jgi:ATP-dependent Lon protease